MAQRVLLAAALAVLLIVTFARVPGSTALSETLQNAGHAPAFGIFALAIVYVFWRNSDVALRPALRLYALAFLASLVAGVVVELMQAATGRQFSASDLFVDAVGALCGLTGHAHWKLRGTVLARRPGVRFLPWICVLCLAIASAPALWSFTAYANRNARFPVLAEFATPLDLYFVRTPGSRAMLVSDSGQAGEKDPRVEVRVNRRFPGNWPGFQLDEPVADWRGYKSIVLEIANPDSSPLMLNLLIHDQLYDDVPDDGFLQRLSLGAFASCSVRIPLQTIERAPEGRSMDLGRMAGIVIFGGKSIAGRRFVVRRIWLEDEKSRRSGVSHQSCTARVSG